MGRFYLSATKDVVALTPTSRIITAVESESSGMTAYLFKLSKENVAKIWAAAELSSIFIYFPSLFPQPYYYSTLFKREREKLFFTNVYLFAHNVFFIGIKSLPIHYFITKWRLYISIILILKVIKHWSCWINKKVPAYSPLHIYNMSKISNEFQLIPENPHGKVSHQTVHRLCKSKRDTHHCSQTLLEMGLVDSSEAQWVSVVDPCSSSSPP